MCEGGQAVNMRPCVPYGILRLALGRCRAWPLPEIPHMAGSQRPRRGPSGQGARLGSEHPLSHRPVLAVACDALQSGGGQTGVTARKVGVTLSPGPGGLAEIGKAVWAKKRA